MIGTPEYMSPEQVRGEEADQRSDIYSLGIILFEMVTGITPFKGDSPLGIALKHKNEQPPDPMEINPEISEALSQLILNCLEKDKGKRPQTTLQLLAQLDKMENEIPSKLKRILWKKRIGEEKKKRFHSFSIPGIPVLIVLFGFAGYLIFNQFFRDSQPGNTAVPHPQQKKMIVVFPFENLSSPLDKYFSRGITDEIISRLGAVHELGVISSTSASQYDREGKMLKQIGVDLGVDYVLDGTIRWDNGANRETRVRVTPHLIRVSDDTQIWSESYDRVIDDIFAVQSEIAEQVIKQLGITLLDKELMVMRTKPTENIDAYQAYLRGMNYMERADYFGENIRLAEQMLELATKLEPSFALAYAELSQVHSSLYHHGYDRSGERIVKAKESADRALNLKPHLPEGYVALGYYYYWCRKEYNRALAELAIAEKNLPNNTRILEAIGYIRRRQGKFDESIESLKKAMELSPQNASLATNLAQTYMAIRKYSEAEYYFNRSISLVPEQVVAYQFKAKNYWLWKGDVQRTRGILSEMPLKDEAASIYYWFLQEVFERNYQAALDRVSAAPFESFELQELFIPKDQLIGYVYHLLNKPELARKAFQSARTILENEIKKRPDDHRVHSSLGIIYASLDLKEKAIREGKFGVKLFPIAKDAIYGPKRVEDLAYIYALVGDQKKAMDQIEYMLSVPCYFSTQFLRLNPKWSSLSNNPRFERIVAENLLVRTKTTNPSSYQMN
jgi:TolB-like protein/Tfp pilus assembly protein PilF